MNPTTENRNHLSEAESTAYLQRSLTPEARLRADSHLSACPSCRRRVHLDQQEAQAIRSLQAEGHLDALEEDPHLSYEEMEAYLLGRADAVVTEIVEGHTLLCTVCATELNELREFRALLDASRADAETDAAHTLIVDTLGSVEIAGRKTLMKGLQTRSRALTDHLGELLGEGIVRPLQSLQTRIDAMNRAATLSFARSSSKAAPLPVSPAFTALRTAPPLLAWSPVPNADAYTVVIASLNSRGERDAVVWKSDAGTEPEVRLPADVALRPGKMYLWYVVATVAQEERPSPIAWFTLLAPSAIRQLEREEQQAEGSALALACLYERHALYGEALAQVEKLRALNPEHPRVETMFRKLLAQGKQEIPTD
jgi:anti-sigma factor RsiW